MDPHWTRGVTNGDREYIYVYEGTSTRGAAIRGYQISMTFGDQFIVLDKFTHIDYAHYNDPDDPPAAQVTDIFVDIRMGSDVSTFPSMYDLYFTSSVWYQRSTSGYTCKALAEFYEILSDKTIGYAVFVINYYATKVSNDNDGAVYEIYQIFPAAMAVWRGTSLKQLELAQNYYGSEEVLPTTGSQCPEFWYFDTV